MNGKDPFRAVQPFSLCDLLAWSHLLRPLPSIICFKYWRKWICPRDWMSSGSVDATHASQWSVCAGFSFMQTHTQQWVSTILSSPPECACMCGSIFSMSHTHTRTHTRTHAVVCFQRDVSGQHHVKDSVRWSLTFGPELCRRDAFVPSAGGGSRADLIVCTSECSLQHQCAAPLHVMRKRLIAAPYS